MICALPEAERVSGVTVLDGLVYMLRDRIADQVEAYDVVTYDLRRRLKLPNARRFSDMTSCEYYQHVYVSDAGGRCVHRLDAASGGLRTWSINDVPTCLSVNVVRNLLVTCGDERKIKEFSSSGYYLRDIALPPSVVNPRHALELGAGGFVVCHGSKRLSDPVHRVCRVSADGRRVLHAHGGRPGAERGQYDGPHHLAVDEHQFVFVVDVFNRRVTVLSPTLDFARQLVVCGRDARRWPSRLCLDVERQRLYVTENEMKYGGTTTGRVVVFSVST